MPTRDRACLRVVGRAGAATAQQLATLVYHRERTAQERLLRLWKAGLLERSPAPQHGPGTSPYAYRLSPAARAHRGMQERRPHGPIQLRHTLDGVSVVSALVEHARRPGQPVVSAWLPESMLKHLDLGPGIAPDGLLVLTTGSRSAVLCVEIDEGTQHAAVIRPRLTAYARALPDHPGWRLLVVVPSETRAAWMRRIAIRVDPRPRTLGCVATMDAITRSGTEAVALSLDNQLTVHLHDVLQDRRPRATGTVVGAREWVALLGQGGGEELLEILR